MRAGSALPWFVIVPCIMALVPYTLFIIIYGVRSPWWKTPVGRSLMVSNVVIIMLLGHLLVVITSPYPGRLFVWAALFVLWMGSGVFQLVMLLRLQRRNRKEIRDG